MARIIKESSQDNDAVPLASQKPVVSEEDDEPPSFNQTFFNFPGITEKSNRALIEEAEDSQDRPAPLFLVKNDLSSTQLFRLRYFPTVSDRSWNDWKWQVRNRIRKLTEFEKILDLSDSERAAIGRGSEAFPIGITPYYMSLLTTDDPEQGLRRTMIPTMQECIQAPGEAIDPLHEEGDSPVPGLVHRYPDRVLFLVTDFCSSYCRFCTRSRVVGRCKITPKRNHLEKAIEYIRDHTSIRDVLLSGGDPLTLETDVLDWILGKLHQIPHVQMIRIGTKTPAVLPQRITKELTRVLRKHHPLWMSLHFTHPNECTPEAYAACAKLANAGIPLGSQTVLLKGVNDSVEVMMDLVHQLLQMRVRPYYLYQCDQVIGTSHLRVPVEKGLEIIQGLRGFTSGYAVPTYVIDAPGGGGKIPIMPNSVVARDGDDLIIRNYMGKTFHFRDSIDSL